MKITSVLSSICILAVLLGTGCEKTKSAVPEGTMELLRLVPKDANVVAVAHMEELKKSFLYDWLEKRGEKEGEVERNLREFQEETGVDPKRDIEIAMFSATGGLMDPSYIAVLIRGRFDRSAIEDLLKEKGAEVEEYEGCRLYSPVEGKGPSMAFLDDRTFVLGMDESVHTAVDLRRGREESFAETPDRMALVQGLEYRDQFWCLADVNDVSRGIAGRALGRIKGEFDLGNIVAAIQQVVFSADIRNSVDVSCGGICAEQKDAELLARALRGVVAFGRAGAEEGGDLMGLLDGIRIRSEQERVWVTVSVSREMVERLEEKEIEKLDL